MQISTKEIWRAVPGYPGYLVSDMGQVRGRRGWVLKPFTTGNGNYRGVSLHENGARKIKRVHRLVALAFIGPIPDGYDVCHLNGDKLDNRLVNLKYVTPKENRSHMVRHGTLPQGESVGTSKLTEHEVKYILEHYKPRDRKFGGAALSRKLGVSSSTISQIINRIGWKYIHESD